MPYGHFLDKKHNNTVTHHLPYSRSVVEVYISKRWCLCSMRLNSFLLYMRCQTHLDEGAIHPRTCEQQRLRSGGLLVLQVLLTDLETDGVVMLLYLIMHLNFDGFMLMLCYVQTLLRISWTSLGLVFSGTNWLATTACRTPSSLAHWNYQSKGIQRPESKET